MDEWTRVPTTSPIRLFPQEKTYGLLTKFGFVVDWKKNSLDPSSFHSMDYLSLALIMILLFQALLMDYTTPH